MNLLDFEYDIVNQSDKENKVADALIRQKGSSLSWVVHEEEAVLEDYDDMALMHPHLILQGKNVLEGKENFKTPIKTLNQVILRHV